MKDCYSTDVKPEHVPETYVAPNTAVSKRRVETTIYLVIRRTVSTDWVSV